MLFYDTGEDRNWYLVLSKDSQLIKLCFAFFKTSNWIHTYVHCNLLEIRETCVGRGWADSQWSSLLSCTSKSSIPKRKTCVVSCNLLMVRALLFTGRWLQALAKVLLNWSVKYYWEMTPGRVNPQGILFGIIHAILCEVANKQSKMYQNLWLRNTHHCFIIYEISCFLKDNVPKQLISSSSYCFFFFLGRFFSEFWLSWHSTIFFYSS